MDIVLEGSQLILRFINDVAWIAAVETTLTHFCAFAGMIAAIIGFQVYISKPDDISFATWFMFVFGDALEASSYWAMTAATLTMNVIPMTFAIGSFLVFALALKNKQLGWPDWKDTAVTGVDVGISVGWAMGRWGAVSANLAAVSTEVISFIPACRDILKGKERPYIAPWIWWAIADGFFFLAVISQPHDREDIFYPLLQMLAHLGVVACIMVRRRMEQPLVLA